MKNRKHLGLTLLVILLVFLSFTVATVTAPPVPRTKNDNEPNIEKIITVYYKKGFAKPDKPPKPNKPGGGPACYGFLGKGVVWKELPVDLKINPTNSGMDSSVVYTAIYLSGEEWDGNTGTNLFNSYSLDYTATFDFTTRDGENELVFGNYNEAGVIAITYTWGIFGGPPKDRKIVEFDIMFDTDFDWGDADLETDPVMDLQNIATHEIGHGIGLADVYDNDCSSVTMYGYGSYDEIIKRDLAPQDITGLQKLYGA